jgi:ssRNA-specific RNase YbeY (16S rRNA maturation enzyme)
LLHLLGHDHRNDREERAMTAATKELERVALRRS